MDCVSESMVHSIEAQYKMITGHDVNLSQRFVAKMSGTTRRGNYQTTVADAIKKFGIPLESDWPHAGPDATWEEYYAEIPQSVKDKALWLLDQFDFKYEFVGKEVADQHQKQAPLQAIIEATNPYHAQMLIKMGQVFDSYPPYIVPLKSVYDFLKPLLTLKQDHQPMKAVNDNGTVYLVGPKGKIGLADAAFLDALKAIGDIEQGSTAGIPQVRVIESQQTFIVKDQ